MTSVRDLPVAVQYPSRTATSSRGISRRTSVVSAISQAIHSKMAGAPDMRQFSFHTSLLIERGSHGKYRQVDHPCHGARSHGHRACCEPPGQAEAAGAVRYRSREPDVRFAASSITRRIRSGRSATDSQSASLNFRLGASFEMVLQYWRILSSSVGSAGLFQLNWSSAPRPWVRGSSALISGRFLVGKLRPNALPVVGPQVFARHRAGGGLLDGDTAGR